MSQYFIIFSDFILFVFDFGFEVFNLFLKLYNISSNSSVFIELVRCYNIPFSIQIPNSFTPNFDGNNDEFKINGTSFEIISVTIFNRWGQVIFNTSNNLAWDGRLNSGEKSPEGTYYYLVEFKAFKPNGNFDTKIEKGTISLFR